MPSYFDSLSALSGQGFEVSGFFPVTLDERLRLIEFDCLMVNRNRRFIRCSLIRNGCVRRQVEFLVSSTGLIPGKVSFDPLSKVCGKAEAQVGVIEQCANRVR